MPWAEIAIFPAPFAASGVVWFFWGLPAVLWTWGALAVFFSLVVAVPLFLDLFRRRK